MTIQTINIGTVPNDGTGDSARTAFDKLNQNFTDSANGAAALVQASPTDATAGRLLNNETTEIGGFVNYTGANLNPNVFKCTGASKRIAYGVGLNASTAAFFLPTSLADDASSITVVGTFNVVTAFSTPVTGGTGVTPALSASTNAKNTVVVVTGLSGLTTDINLILTSTDATSEITVNT